MALPNLRNIFASFRTAHEERQYSQAAFYKFLGFILVSLGMSLVAHKGRRAIK
ncbi:BZ3500_MvSof-1268-A1-R1_Chr5-2g08044 [Microbotryum saponariae]|uniref:BZ3500_MvSof-1268-A1-R1_Chr5-2g08044 protein n=1 Tax=Microbotryum saponariae TaxID=289078 RepID=A0A2X0M1Y7_9BASI|nr:BZ3500_MvSof-1268-A1-R1_Chr5-2g08044 [Microbotryum saponariae]SDA05913.1 BZ3501_MvSof-1269-A2-R1_Chr5-2g07866 [Microbotryum saponariae]